MVNFLKIVALSVIAGSACLIFWGYVWVFWLIGFVLLFSGFVAMTDTRQKDRRFKNGYKDNVEDRSDLGLGLKLISASIVVFLIAFNARDILHKYLPSYETKTSSSIQPVVVEKQTPDAETSHAVQFPAHETKTSSSIKPTVLEKNTPDAEPTHAAAASEAPRQKVFTDEEIDKLEEEKQYHGNDPIVRARLGLPSRTTR